MWGGGGSERIQQISPVFLNCLLLFPSGKQKVTFYVKSLVFSRPCSNFEHLSLKLSHIFLLILKFCIQKIKILSIYQSVQIVGFTNMLNLEKRLIFYMIVRRNLYF